MALVGFLKCGLVTVPAEDLAIRQRIGAARGYGGAMVSFPLAPTFTTPVVPN